MFRDNNCCVFTGAVDTVHVLSQSGGHVTKELMAGRKMSGTKVAHIISQSLSDNISYVDPTVRKKVIIFSAISVFGFADLIRLSMIGQGPLAPCLSALEDFPRLRCLATTF